MITFLSPIRCVLFSVAMLSVFLANSQTISGTVKNAKTGEPMAFANVFINNTTLGSTTDDKGNFIISGSLPRNVELVASYVGFETDTKTLSIGSSGSTKVDFKLKPLESVLTEVELKSRRDKKWERDLRRFKQVFLALPNDPFASQLDIKNPWVLDFETVKADGPNYVRATAQEPLHIVNHALGYDVTYYLKDYRYYHNRSSYVGFVFFDSQELADTVELAKIESNKVSSYMGSIRHLLKSVLLAKVHEENFQIFEVLPDDHFRVRTNVFTEEVDKSIRRVFADSIQRIPLENGNYRVIWPFKAEIHYPEKFWLNDYYTDLYYPVSWVSAPLGYFDIDRNGIPVVPSQVILSGYMGRQRMGRFLPHDYEPAKSLEGYGYLAEVDSSQMRFSRWNNLREKPYFNTNKPYYYPGETVWLGGQMLYQNSIMSDTLSRVVYIDLMDKDSKVIQSEIFPIKEGRIAGGFILPNELKADDYFLRAYTEWMRNFPNRDIFLRALPVLEKEESIQTVAIVNPDLVGELTINLSDSLFFRDSDKEMEFQLSFLDETEELTDAQFTVSLTDADLVSTLDGQVNILDAMEWLDAKEPPKKLAMGNHQIEFGITIEGQFTRDKKRDPLVNPITVVRDDLADYGIVNTDSSGYFRVTGLYFTDTATISIAALDSRQRHYGSVTINEKSKPTFKGSYPKLNYQTFQRKNDELKFDFTGDFVLLEEFVKEDTKMVTLEERNYGYGTPDRELSGDRLETISSEALAGYFGFKRGGKSIGNYNFGLNASNPLVIIDGTQYPFLNDEAFETLMGTFIPAELESIKVYTFNSTSFGMAGFGGVIMITTKKGNRIAPVEQTAFNHSEFQKFRVRGFSREIPFPNSFENNQPVESKPTLYWDATAESKKGIYSFKVKIPQALKRMNLRVEGLTKNGLAFEKTFEIAVK
ncbi:carboxypeptidase-like regulatory domain-containing protein [Algoriphagus sp. AGSA1]|uniref:carboxypeptidase-like regulatory domain-containing protein n=1 Tax=Algoriphagus sp. AGSA1 TaxID=2907213 RepID=UPI001F3ECCB4|nr:carboxypeptidase-like regulatory domain-containing protein [Algoriphagus sp. AGSA1]MCE7056058.1 carboxypeptidase-like regulatory domain-containing protein [Algoriphagus sp. AGSA1]